MRRLRSLLRLRCSWPDPSIAAALERRLPRGLWSSDRGGHTVTAELPGGEAGLEAPFGRPVRPWTWVPSTAPRAQNAHAKTMNGGGL